MQYGNSERNNTVFDGKVRVVQTEMKSAFKARVEQLEKKLNKHLESEKKEETESGPAEIRTQDLRRVKATS